MSVFCTPDGRPFYAGTYFPPVERHGMPSFRRVVQALGDAWVNERAQVLEQADALVGAVQRELRLAEALREEAGGGGARRRPAGPAAGRRSPGGAASTPTRSSNRWSPASRRASTPSGAASGPRRSSPGRPSSSSACVAPGAAAPTRRTRGTWPCARSTPWRPAASTTTWSVGSAATRPTRAGSCPTSRRCSPTRRSWPGPTCTRGRTAGGPSISAWSPRPWTSCCGTSRRPRARCTRPSTPTPAASRARTPPSRVDELRQILPPPWSNRRPSGTASRRAATGRAAPSRSVRSGAPLERPPEVEEARLLLAAARAQRVQPARDEKVLTEWNAMTVATLAEVASATGSSRLRTPGRGDRRVPLGLHVRRTGG